MTGRSSAPAVDQAARILTHLARQRGPTGAAVIATALGLPRSTVYRILGVLVQHGFVVHFPEEMRYGVGVVAHELAIGFARQEPLARLGAPILAGLVDRVSQSAHLAVLNGRDVVYIVEERAPRRPVLVTDVGVRLPAMSTASGRAMLAQLPDAQVRAMFPNAGAFADVGSPSSYRELRELIRDTRRRGHGWEDGDVSAGLASVAVAVRDHTGWPAASIAVTFEVEQVPPSGLPALVAEIERDARELGRRIHGL